MSNRFRQLRTIIFVLLLFFLLSSILNSQTLTSSKTVENYRAEDAKRTFNFSINSQPFGTLESIYDGPSRHEGVRAHRFKEKLTLDFSSFPEPYILKIENEHYVDDSGRYVGDDMKLHVGEKLQELLLAAKNSRLTGYLETQGSKDNIDLPYSRPFFALDNNMIDQLELFLAMKSFKVGDTITDSFFIPQTSIYSSALFIVEGFTRIPYGSMIDSAFICRFIEPLDQTAYITRDKRLIKLVQPFQNITVVQVENLLDRIRPPKKTVTVADHVKRLPVYLLFLIVVVILTAPFWLKNFKKPPIYVAFLMGLLSYFLIGITHVPLQEWYSARVVIPAVQQGGSLYAYTLGNSLLTGLVQELIKLLPILLLFYFWKQTRPLLVILGIFCGAGYGLFESGALTGAAYQAGIMKLVSWGTFERTFSILFHITSGALYGWALRQSIPKLVWIYIALSTLHTFTTYMIIFVQRKIIDLALYELFIAIIYLILLLVAYLLISGSRLLKSAPSRKR